MNHTSWLSKSDYDDEFVVERQVIDGCVVVASCWIERKEEIFEIRNDQVSGRVQDIIDREC